MGFVMLSYCVHVIRNFFGGFSVFACVFFSEVKNRAPTKCHIPCFTGTNNGGDGPCFFLFGPRFVVCGFFFWAFFSCGPSFLVVVHVFWSWSTFLVHGPCFWSMVQSWSTSFVSRRWWSTFFLFGLDGKFWIVLSLSVTEKLFQSFLIPWPIGPIWNTIANYRENQFYVSHHMSQR